MSWLSQTEKENVTTAEFAPETFKQVYKDAWFKTHKVEAAVDNPNPEAELEIIDLVVTNETESDEIDTSAEAVDGTNGDAGPAAEDPSGTGRKLASVIWGLYRPLFECLESRVCLGSPKVIESNH